MPKYDDCKFYTLGCTTGEDPIKCFYKNSVTVCKQQYSAEQTKQILDEASQWKITQAHCETYEPDWADNASCSWMKGEVDTKIFPIVVLEGHFAGWRIATDDECLPCKQCEVSQGLLLVPQADYDGKHAVYSANATGYGSSSVRSYTNTLRIEQG